MRLHELAKYLGVGTGRSYNQGQSKQGDHRDHPHLRLRQIQHLSFSFKFSCGSTSARSLLARSLLGVALYPLN
jgi:hypothetical protein